MGLACALLLGLAVPLLGGCRHRAPESKQNLDELFISNRRINIDEEREVVRIYGRLQNTGARRFRRVMIYATLRSAGGDPRGDNHIPLTNIEPHEQRAFAFTVTSRAQVASVELEVRPPDRP